MMIIRLILMRQQVFLLISRTFFRHCLSHKDRDKEDEGVPIVSRTSVFDMGIITRRDAE